MKTSPQKIMHMLHWVAIIAVVAAISVVTLIHGVDWIALNWKKSECARWFAPEAPSPAAPAVKPASDPGLQLPQERFPVAVDNQALDHARRQEPLPSHVIQKTDQPVEKPLRVEQAAGLRVKFELPPR